MEKMWLNSVNFCLNLSELSINFTQKKRVPKQHPKGCYLAVHNLAPLGVLFWHPIDRGVLFSDKKRLKTVPLTLKGAKMVPLYM